MKARPVGKYIIINKVNTEVKTESGLFLTGEDMKDFRYRLGEVVVPGIDVDCVEVGSKIYYDRSAGHEMIINDTPYTIISERDVVVVLD
tara:strand:+ start:493 stop:759 length:267 start_codon:yes stop_codon:yes gene_type:complete